MKAPDKIYVEVCEDGIFAFEKPPFEESIEYVRKDALMEWANKALSIRRDSGDDYFIQAIVILNDLIDKLNSM